MKFMKNTIGSRATGPLICGAHCKINDKASRNTWKEKTALPDL